MKIENLRLEKDQRKVRVISTVTWENCERPSYDLYFETEEEFTESLSCNPHAFLVGCIVPAMYYGEERIFIEAEICPELRQGLITAMSWLRHWYYKPERELVRIEAKTSSGRQESPRPERAGLFFSGGVDSFATLRRNRLYYPLEHPGSIKDGILVYGLELDDPKAFTYVLQSLAAAAPEAGITLIPMYTNVYLNYREEDARQGFRFWEQEFGSAALSAVAHALAKRLTVVSIAANDDIPNVEPDGTHPLLDPNYSSGDLRIKHELIELSRMERTRLVAAWDVALHNVRTCNRYRCYRSHQLNCGRCEKCVRTMLTLLALGALEHSPAFVENDVSPDRIFEAVTSPPGATSRAAFEESMVLLKKQGRQDLARAIRHVLAKTNRQCWKRKIAELDKKFLDGNLRRLKHFRVS